MMGAPLRILMLEDNSSDADLVEQELRRAGLAFVSTRVETEEKFIEALREVGPDLILADYTLPSFGGMAALAIARERCPDVPFLFVSGTMGEEVAIETLKSGATDYVLKSGIARLAPAVRRALGEAKERAERKLVEDQLRLKQAALESAANAIVITDRDGRITWVNPAFSRLTGYTMEEVIGRNPRLLKSGRHDQSFYENLWATILTGQVWHGEVINKRKDGTAYIEEQTIAPVRGDGGDISHFIAIKQDITASKQAEEARQALYRVSRELQWPAPLHERLDRLLQTARDALHVDRMNLFLPDSDGRWLQAVASVGTEDPLEAVRVPIGPEGGGLAHAYDTQQPILWDGRSPVPEHLRLGPPYDRIAALRSRAFALVPLTTQGRVIGILVADRKQSRRPLDPATVDMLHLFASQAAPAIEQARLYEELRMAAIQLEATVEARTRELREANRQLEKASRHKSEFLANISHDLRTPLNAVIGFAELLQEPATGPLTAKQARFVQNVLTSGRLLLQLINDILDLSKIEAGRTELRHEPVRLLDLIEAVHLIVSPEAGLRRHTVEYWVEAAFPLLSADPVRLKQIFFNLLSNAIKFTPDGGRILVTARRVHSSQFTVHSEPSTSYSEQPGEFAEITVKDTGIGITPEDQEVIFEEFRQLDSSMSRRHKGTGLGLAITKRLVELHGGRVWVESAFGRGSTFTFTLPLSAQDKSEL